MKGAGMVLSDWQPKSVPCDKTGQVAMDARHIAIFDGACNLCARGVQFILAHERDHVIRFTALQSPTGQGLLREFGIDPQHVATFAFIEGVAIFVGSDAAIEVAKHLRLPWRMFRVLRVVPRRIRESIYGLVARNRYRWFGKRESCVVPTPELRSRFIDASEVQQNDSDPRPT
jgi:predicted DCC family thiol-disulfide oxidoreductase YuxK